MQTRGREDEREIESERRKSAREDEREIESEEEGCKRER